MVKDKETVLEKMCFGVLCLAENAGHLVKCESVLGKPVVHLDAAADKALTKAYWKLDGNAFDDQPAPIFMKLDTLVLGGLPVAMLLPKEYADPALCESLEAGSLDYVPIGFLDLHKIDEGKFTASGLGIAKPYQGLGLSKYLIYAGAVIAGIEELIIPTQLHNAAAHLAWLHLGPLELLSADVFHNEQDTVVYKATVPWPAKDILKPHKKQSPQEQHDTCTLDLTDTVKAMGFLVEKMMGFGNVQTVDYCLGSDKSPIGPVVIWESDTWGEGGCYR